jgi:hypothetical protein
MKSARTLCWMVLFGGLSWVIILTAGYFDPPATDMLLMKFLKSGAYLPVGDTFTTIQVAGPVGRILEEDRQGYRQIFFVSLASCIAALGVALIPRQKDRDQHRNSIRASVNGSIALIALHRTLCSRQ